MNGKRGPRGKASAAASRFHRRKSTMADTYTPRPGSVPWRTIDFLIKNPDEELTRGDVAVKFDCVGTGVDTALTSAVNNGVLKKGRNSEMELVWLLGDASKVTLLPWLDQPAARAPAPAPAASLSAWGESLRHQPGMPTIRRGVRLLNERDRQELEYDTWLVQFGVGDSAEFAEVRLDEIKKHARRYQRKNAGVRFIFAPTRDGQHGIERRA